MASSPSIRRNDYGPLRRPVGEWTPSLSASVVIPAHGQQEKLDVVLAALAAQTYPEELLEVVVVDDCSDPALRLPDLCPKHAKIVRPLPGGWASAHATNSGVERSDGDVILRLDSDMLAFADHVESQMRWHHAADYLTVLGHKRFVDYQAGDLDPREVYERVGAGGAAELFDLDSSEPQWIEAIIDRTDGLKDADHRAFRVLVGASFSVPRGLYKASGGMDADVILGSDTIFGYRLHQAGAVFVPDVDSSSWHLGPRQISARGDLAKRYRRPHIANRVPELDTKRPRARRSWVTPLAEVVVGAGPGTESCVDKVLAGSVPDVRVTLLGEWPKPLPERHAPLDDPDLDARLQVESFRGEPRVRTASEVEDDPTVPYRIWLPEGAKPHRDAVASLIGYANEHRLGLLEVVLPEGVARLERTAAAARAAHLGSDIAEVWGAERVTEGALVDALLGVKRSGVGDVGRAPDGLGRRSRRILRRVLGRR
ncbi:glycosyltransferase [Glycomyces sp. L485]|uniref:glycosyltransferase n=1 Tax=Glycomyces sp. L485 TaxID=2909235 RepID=UPI001F4ABD45|nr:glycosyltransferase family 2 protein [Glycomyces sp. L485]MCH7232142.1 glycosyltransferase [Glycomyces sp. L485]